MGSGPKEVGRRESWRICPASPMGMFKWEHVRSSPTAPPSSPPYSRTYRGKRLLPVTGDPQAPEAGGKGGGYCGYCGDLRGTWLLHAAPRARAPHQWHGSASPTPHRYLLSPRFTLPEPPKIPKTLGWGLSLAARCSAEPFPPLGDSSKKVPRLDIGQVVSLL